MRNWTRIGLSSLLTGTSAATLSAAALVLLSLFEGRSGAQPLNATSHWLHGDDAAAEREADLPHTGVGGITHLLSAVFWAVPFEIWQSRRPAQTPGELARDATVMSAIAAAVDYGLTPKRFTPGWELVLPTRSMALAYGALALGLALGGGLSRRLVDRMEARDPD